MHGVRLVSTPPANTRGSATAGCEESRCERSGAIIVEQEDSARTAQAPIGPQGTNGAGAVLALSSPRPRFTIRMPPKRRSAPSRQLSRSLPHLAIESVRPELDAGRFAPKRVVGDRIEVSADIFKDGHDLLAAHVRVRGPADAEWRTVPMTYDFNSDRWSADFVADAVGTWTFSVEAWTDRFATWRSELQKRVDAGYDVSSEVLEGAQRIDRAARKCRFGPVRTSLKHWVTLLRDSARHPTERAREAFDPALFSLIEEYLPADDLTAYDRVLAVRV